MGFDPLQSWAKSGIVLVVAWNEPYGSTVLLTDIPGGCIGKIVEASGSL